MKRILFICIFLLLIPLTANAQKTLQDATASTATGDTLPIGSSTTNGVLAQITGTFSGTITWRATFNGTDYVDVQATNLTTGTTSTTATAAGLYSILAPRIVAFRAPVTTYASGTITVTAAAANGVARMGSSGAPIDATFITQTSSSTLSAEQALSALATGLLKNTTATGVLSIAGASDLPSGIDAAKIADASVSNAEFQRLDGVTSGIQVQIDSKQAALGFTPENVANKSTDGTLASNSDTLYASQKATKTYADTKEVPLTFSSPLVRTVNAVACATCVIASSPGAGIAHFAGSTQTVTSSPIVNADITNGTIDLTTKVTGVLPAANGGTGVANNAASTITISGNFGTTFTVTGATNVTLPTSGTLATTGGRIDQNNASTTSAQFFSVISDETGGSGVVVGSASPTLTGTATIPAITGVATITGTTGNMTITSGTGASRTMILQTTTSGGVATTALTLGADQSATFAGPISIGATQVLSVSSSVTNVGATNSGVILNGGAYNLSSGIQDISIGWAGSGIFGIKAAGTMGFVASTTDARGNPDTTFSRISAGLFGVGTGAQGSFAGSLKLTDITAVGANVIFSGLGSDATHTDATVCADSTTGLLYKGSGTLGICVGTSSARFKNSIHNLNEGLNEILALRPVNYFYDRTHGDGGRRLQYGFTAENTQKVLPVLVGLDSEGKPNSVDMLGMFPVMVKAIQEMHVEIESLKAEIQSLKQPRRIAFHLPSVIGL